MDADSTVTIMVAPAATHTGVIAAIGVTNRLPFQYIEPGVNPRLYLFIQFVYDGRKLAKRQTVSAGRFERHLHNQLAEPNLIAVA